METLEIIISLLEKKHISQKKFLSDIGLNASAMSEWKAGRNQSYFRHIDKIAAYFHVTTDFLLTGEERELVFLSDDDREMLELYQKLDAKGKVMVKAIGYDELDRLKEELAQQESGGTSK